MEFRLLGEVDLVLAGRGVVLGHGKQRCVVAAQCGHVPMALRVRAANLLLRPGSSVAGAVSERAFQLSSRSVGQTSASHAT